MGGFEGGESAAAVHGVGGEDLHDPVEDLLTPLRLRNLGCLGFDDFRQLLRLRVLQPADDIVLEQTLPAVIAEMVRGVLPAVRR
jgi:hypothetical protein